MLTVLQATTQNSVYLPPSNSLTASQRTEQAIQDSISFNSYASYLRGLYTSMSQSHTSQHWSHLPRCEFVQLAMIGNEREIRRGDREEEMVRLAQQGRIETIMGYKEPIVLNNLFAIDSMQPLVEVPPPDPPRVILIEGVPGGGKSTLALHICHKWARGDVLNYLDIFNLVVLVYLRDQAIQNATTLADILPTRNLEMSQFVASQIKDRDGQNILFIFDGWDEFPSHLQTNSLVSTIIRQPRKLSLHQSTVLITSRPVSSGNLLHIADQRVEILGFTQHQIRDYIDKALDGNSTRVQKLVQHLEEHPVIEGYCYVPLHVAILVHIFLTMKGALPTTLHELFCNLALCCIARELETHESESFVSCSLDYLPDELKSKLSNLSLLAYQGVMQDKVVFYERDLKIVHLPANLPSLGLIQAVEGLTLLSKSLSYNFLHLSVQELLAAYHISHMDSSEQLKVFKQMFGSSRFQAVLHYFSGFTKLTSPPIRDFISSYSKQKSSIKDLLPLLNCFYEAQDLSLSNLVNFRIISLDSHLSPVDYLAIGYYITSLLSVPSSDTSNVQLKLLKIDDHGLKLLLLELSKYRTISACAARLEIEIVFSTNIIEKTKLITSFLEQSSVVTHFRGTGLVATEDIVQALTTMLQVNNTLTHLDLSNNDNFAHFGLGTWFNFESLQCNTTLVHLNLSNTGLVVTEATAEALTTMLQVNKTLTHLDLSNNWEFHNASCGVFQGLQNNTTLVYLNLSNIMLEVKKDTPLAKALTTMLQENKHLKNLDLSYNSLYNEGAYCLCEGLQHNTTLVYLNLSSTGITDKGVEYIAQAYNSNRPLQLNLDVSYNLIKDKNLIRRYMEESHVQKEESKLKSN